MKALLVGFKVAGITYLRVTANIVGSALLISTCPA
jgi:hypothetical protein